MFIWDFMAETVLGQIVDWIYSQRFPVSLDSLGLIPQQKAT